MTDPNALIVRNAAVFTMNPRQPWAEAFAIRDGRLAAVGSEVQVRAAAPGAAEVDLHGRMVIPGLIDVHNHFVWAGRAELYEANFPPILSFAQVLDRVRAAAATKAPDEWIVGGIFGSGLLPELTAAARLALDDAAGGRPVMLRDDSHHNRFASSAALALAGIEATTPNPPGGEIVRDSLSGEITGLLKEGASALVEAAVARALAADPQLDVNAAAHAVARMNAYGITGVQEALTTRAVLKAVKALEDQGRLTAWVVGSLPVTEAPLAPGEAGEEILAMRETYRSRHFRPDAGKIFLDGVPTSRTAAMLEPYNEDPAYGCCWRGGAALSVPQLARVLADCEKRGMAVKIHCAGDAAVRIALDAIDVLRSFNGPGLMHQIAHASFVDPAEVPRFAALNVLADLSPIIWFPCVIVEAIRQSVPSARVDRFWPNRDLLDAGALIAAGSDWPVVPDPDPWLGLQGLVTRRDPSGRFPGALWPEQAMPLEAALAAYTINPARALRLDDVTGSLEAGKSADFVVLDRHLFRTPVEQLAQTKVQATVFEGRVVHGALP